MAVIHHTSLTPGKLELLTSWLPRQPWYRGRTPALRRLGGFRLDDPAGEVGIEIMFVSDGDMIAYQVPLSYRGAPLEGADAALIGTAEHGVLGRRWIYDGTRDPVVVAQLLALVAGEAEAQHQDESDTVDRSVTSTAAGSRRVAPVHPLVVDDSEVDRSSIAVESIHPAGMRGRQALQVVRVLWSEADVGATGPAGAAAYVEADVPRPGRAAQRRRVLVLT